MTARAADAMPTLTLEPVTSRINAFQQWWVLTERGLLKVLRNGEFIFAFVSPVFLAVCFYLPLRKVVAEVTAIDYAQYLMPIIMLQSMAFVASSSAMRSALDGQAGVHARFRVLPMSEAIPFLARSATNAVLLVVALACGLVTCLVMGWRPESAEVGGGIAGAAIAVALVGMIGMALSLVSDGIGLVAKSPAATSQLVAFPTLILGMLSTGFMPVDRFPEWIQGFVENQPISQITRAMRDAIGGVLDWQSLAAAVWWTLGLLVLAAVLVAIGSRKDAQ